MAVALLAVAVLPTSLWAQTGRLTVESDGAESDVANGHSVYFGNVRLQQNGISLSGDRLTLIRQDNRQLSASMEGQPAKLLHTPEGEDQAVTATAARLTYDTSNGLLKLEGAARIQRGEDQLSADSIEYNLTDQRMRAMGGETERVRITIPAPDLPDAP